jgi:response regulator RpfG family c-di-GMP phosphodiesterase
MINIPIRILFVDDEKNILNSLERLFFDEDFEILIASSGEEALTILKTYPDIGVIVSDQRMPGLCGVDFLEKAKEIAPNALRILLTGYADINISIDVINKGEAYRYITKPWNDDELIAIIRESVQKYSLLKKNQILSEKVKRQNDELKHLNSMLDYLVDEQISDIKKKDGKLQKINKKLRDTYKNTILSLLNILELYDKSVVEHSRNVGKISVGIAEDMGLSSNDIESIAIASLFHDIGKIGMPEILNKMKVDDMNTEQLNLYIKHPIRGQTVIDFVEDMINVGLLTRHHHESFDGMGFPDRLKGQQIPLGSRIIAIADFFDRTIKEFNNDNAVELTINCISEELNKKFDPSILPFLRSSVKKLYNNCLPNNYLPNNYLLHSDAERSIYIRDLEVGMILSRDIESKTGLKMISKGIELNEESIEILKEYCQHNTLRDMVHICVSP